MVKNDSQLLSNKVVFIKVKLQYQYEIYSSLVLSDILISKLKISIENEKIFFIIENKKFYVKIFKILIDEKIILLYPQELWFELEYLI